MGIKIERLQEVVRMRVAMVVLRDLQDPRLQLITITRVRLAGDLSSGKIYWSTLAEGGARSAVAHALEDATGYVQREVAAVLRTRKMPKLEFVFDQSVEGVERLSRILREARAEDDSRAAARSDPAKPAGEEPGGSG